jgi:protein-S-isoprenylcysteine O-methyltransferase Ste14
VLQTIAAFTWYAGSLFLGAGRLDWTRGWICAALWMTGMATIGVLGYRYNPAVMDARAHRRFKDTKRFDKIFWAAYFPLVFLQPAFAGIDAVRFHWSAMPFALFYVGAIAFVLGMALVGWVLCVNPFAEATVRIQTDRGQTVVEIGPYRVVRHPMYVGAFLIFLGQPLMWGSVWALVWSMLTVALMVWRTSREDQTLRQELAGYEEYTARTHYRLVPGVW